MHRALVPEFILAQLAAGRLAGAFPATCLFVDISGFTPLTTRLMKHGIEGAEVLAGVLDHLFAPLIDAVYRQGGFVAGFAGDAFKAVFPGTDAATLLRAAAAAWQIRRQLAQDASQETRLGVFHFTGKVCMAAGEVTWHIRQATPEESTCGQCALFSFAGAALDAAMDADPAAEAGEVILTDHIAAALADTAVTLEPHAGYWRLAAFGATTMTHAVDSIPPVTVAAATRFYPPALLTAAARGEFRQVVTVFANLLPPDASGEQHFFAALFPLLHRYDGYLCRVGRIGGKDVGLTLLVFFGAPVGHENDPARALNFLLELQAAAPAPLRAGVSTGLAFAGFVGSQRREEYTCHGIYVNLAARLMSTAPAGAIWLEEATAQGAHGFALQDAGRHHFKGFAAPLPVQTLVGRRVAPADHFYRSALVGRTREMAALHQTLAPLYQGRCGGVVIVEGEPGMGKSRLIHAFAAQTRTATADGRSGVQWFLAQTDELLQQPLHPFRRWLAEYFEQTTLAATAPGQRFAQRFDLLVDQTEDAALAAALERFRPFLGALVGLHWADSLYEQLEPQLRLDNTLEALKTLIKAESRRRPVVLHVEDVHWLDDLSREFLGRLLRGTEDVPFLLLMTRRPEDRDGLDLSFSSEMARQVIRLDGFVAEELAQFVATRLGGEVAASLSTFIALRAEGNPFFAEQLLLYLQDQGMLVSGPDGWQLAPTAAGDSILTGDMRAMLTARLDRLPPAVRATVQRAAILGREFETPVLSRMQEADRELIAHLALAEKASIWAEVGESRYLFRHALLRDAAYEMQLRGERRALHRQAATAIEHVYPAQPAYYAALAHHSRLGEDLPRERRYAELAGSFAAQQFANGDAVRFFSRALELAEADDLRARFHLLLAREVANHLLGNRAAQRVDLSALLQVTAQLAGVADAVEVDLRLANFAMYMGELADAEGHARSALALAQQDGDPMLIARSQLELGRVLWQRGDYVQSRRALLAAHAGSAAHDPRMRADSTYHLGMVSYFEQDYAGARQAFDTAHTAYAACRDRRGEVLALRMLGLIHYRQGDYVAARRDYEAGLAAAQAIGYRYGEALALQALGNTCYELGDNAGAYAHHTQAAAIAAALADREVSGVIQDTLGLIAQRAGNHPQAQAHYAQALQLQREIGDRRSEAYTLTHLGALLCADGQLPAAQEALTTALAIRRELGDEGGAQDTLAQFALLEWQRGMLHPAAERAAAVAAWIGVHDADSLEDAVEVYWVCYRILTDAAVAFPAFAAQANLVLRQGVQLLADRAARIQDPEMRRAYLSDVPSHHAMATLAQRTGATRPLQGTVKS